MNILQRIEKIVKEADTYLTVDEILRIILDQEDKATFNINLVHESMGILESMGKIIYDGDLVIYTWVDNPKLEKLLKENVMFR